MMMADSKHQNKTATITDNVAKPLPWFEITTQNHDGHQTVHRVQAANADDATTAVNDALDTTRTVPTHVVDVARTT